MPKVKKAELIEGVVYMPSPVSQKNHSGPHFLIILWLGHYFEATPGVEGGDNATVRLDLENEPQPDALLRVVPTFGGQSHDSGDYIGRPPELIVEVAASSVSYDLHDKLRAYQPTVCASTSSGELRTRPSIGLCFATIVTSGWNWTPKAATEVRCFRGFGSIRRH